MRWNHIALISIAAGACQPPAPDGGVEPDGTSPARDLAALDASGSDSGAGDAAEPEDLAPGDGGDDQAGPAEDGAGSGDLAEIADLSGTPSGDAARFDLGVADLAARDLAARDFVMRDQAASDLALPRDLAARDAAAALDLATPDLVTRDLATRDLALSGALAFDSHYLGFDGRATIQLGDVNGDGKVDIVSEFVWFGDGAGHFVAGPAAPAPYVGDLNGDGFADLFDGQVVWIGKGDGTFTKKTTIQWGASNGNIVAIVDFDHDGHLDLLVSLDLAKVPRASTRAWALGHGDGTFAAPVIEGGANVYYGSFRLGDFDGDGRNDIATEGDHLSTILMLSNGGGAQRPASQGSYTGADFDGDGKQDLVMLGFDDLLSRGNTLLASFAGGGLNPRLLYQFDVPPKLITPLAAGDLDGDGKADLVAAGGVFLGNGDASIGPLVPYPDFAESDNVYAVAVDLNGDGRADVIDHRNGELQVILSTVVRPDMAQPADLAGGGCAVDGGGSFPSGDCTGSFGGGAYSLARGVAVLDREVVVGGTFTGTITPVGFPITASGGSDIFLAQIGANNGRCYSSTPQTFGTVSPESLTSLQAGPYGTGFAFCGSLQAPLGLGGAVLPAPSSFVVRNDKTGQHLWSTAFPNQGGMTFQQVAVGAQTVLGAGPLAGTVDLGGGLLTGVSGDLALVMLDGMGHHVWSKVVHNAGPKPTVVVADGAMDGAGSVTLLGQLTGSMDFGGGPLASAAQASFIVQVDSTGKHRFSRIFPPTATVQANAVALTPQGDVVMTGRLGASYDFGTGVLTNLGQGDVFLATLAGGTGATRWAKRFGDPTEQRGFSLAVDQCGAIVLAGTMQGKVDFGGGPLFALASDVFHVRFDGAGTFLSGGTIATTPVGVFAATGVAGGVALAMGTGNDVFYAVLSK